MAIDYLHNHPDFADLIRIVSEERAIVPALVEKDYWIMHCLYGLQQLNLRFELKGGTSLSKGFGIIKRFSEDIDFKLALSEAFLDKSANQRRKLLGALRDALEATWKDVGFAITLVESRDSNGFIRIEMNYPTLIQPNDALRPHILAELSSKPPRLPVQHRPLASFVSQYAGEAPEINAIACVDPVETAADKLSGFAWRMLVRNRSGEKDDATIVRHLHDLAALEETTIQSADFPELLKSTLIDDSARGGGAVAGLAPRERLNAMQTRLAGDALYADEYRQFV
ncbi:MAG: nucleotidyl transferase AbiEii/AbiGii toxin family protein, partial [Caldilineaceae bacterium]|nr:nucleotidyl transferase AbiEii/AbiGii toxin family protein [Caldilineaceae bacterium]